MSEPELNNIHLSSGRMQAEIAPQGATLVCLSREGRDLILGIHDLADASINNFYAGAIVGPVANRVSGGQVAIDGQSFQMECNESGTTSLHSGSDGLHALIWDVCEVLPDSVLLQIHLPDGYSGLPGNREISVLYVLSNDGLAVKITANTDQRTPINIAHHPYWALQSDQSKTKLSIDSDRYLPKTSNGLPTGQSKPVANGPFDFIKPREIGANADLDHNWCLSEVKSENPRPVATLLASDGLQLNIATTEVGMQVYTGSALPILKPFHCKTDQIQPNAGIALEAQGWPDAPNQPGFPNIFVERNETYRQITQYTFTQN